LQRAKNYSNHYTYYYCREHHTLARFHLLWAILAEYECDDYPGKDNYAYQQEGEYPLTELLTAHPFDTEVELGREL